MKQRTVDRVKTSAQATLWSRGPSFYVLGRRRMLPTIKMKKVLIFVSLSKTEKQPDLSFFGAQ